MSSGAYEFLLNEHTRDVDVHTGRFPVFAFMENGKINANHVVA